MEKDRKKKPNKHWLLLMHQLPPQPDAFRVKIWRQLQQIGAVSLKNSVYVLPNLKQTGLALHEVAAEIKAGGGEAFLCDAAFFQGIDANGLMRRFNTDRNKAYQAISKDVEPLLGSFDEKSKPNAEKLMRIDHSIGRLRRQLNEIVAIDFFSAEERHRAASLLTKLEEKVNGLKTGSSLRPLVRQSIRDYQGRTWITRQGLFIDRLASAWLIRKFIDRKAKFKFVDPVRYKRKDEREVRFDMFGGEFTHHGDLCTFETLMQAFRIKDPALIPISEIIHDIDLNDHKYDREEKAGIERIIKGIVHSESNDEKRLARVTNLLDELYSTFKVQDNE